MIRAMRDMRLHMRIGKLEGELEAIRKHVGLVSEREEDDDKLDVSEEEGHDDDE
jgi:hypothetical protein